jgi:signal transduction histidine kinase
MQEVARAVQGAPVRLEDELADAAHELKAPIAVVLALCAGAAEATSLGALQEDVARIEAQLRALRGDLDALLDTARTGHLRAPRAAPADLVALVRDEAEAVAVVAGRRGVAVHVDAARAGGVLHGVVDADRVRCAVRNLLGNAVRHARQDGVVRVALLRQGAWARIEVADDGPGVPEADREDVFDRFRRLERDARAHAGTGLGLAIVRDVAGEHGGDVDVARAPEGGALFALRLPLVSELPAGPARRFRQRGPRLRRV